MVLVVFAVIAVIGQALNLALCLAIDQMISPGIAVLTFVALYMAVFAASWMIAVRIVEGRQRTQATEQRYVTHAG